MIATTIKTCRMNDARQLIKVVTSPPMLPATVAMRRRATVNAIPSS
jgi:hypothetical protein